MNLATERHSLPYFLDGSEQLAGHFVDGFCPIDLNQLALCPVVINQWSSLLQIHVDAPGDRLSLVILTLIKLGTVHVALAGDAGRVELLVIDVAFTLAGPASTGACDQDLGLGCDEGHNID